MSERHSQEKPVKQKLISRDGIMFSNKLIQWKWIVLVLLLVVVALNIDKIKAALNSNSSAMRTVKLETQSPYPSLTTATPVGLREVREVVGGIRW
jgi:hypothetical protein